MSATLTLAPPARTKPAADKASTGKTVAGKTMAGRGVTASKALAGKLTTADKLLIAASELMIQSNSIEVSLSEIAQRSGVNSALVKYHFGNKDGLLLALLARDAATEVTNLEYLLAQSISPTAKLKLHIFGIMKAYQRFPYINRLIHYLLHQSSEEAADEVSKFFVGPLLDFHRRLLAQGLAAGEFRKVDPVLFYNSLIGACDHLFYSRHAVSRAIGVGPVTDQVCRDYVAHLDAMLLGGILATNDTAQASAG